MKTGLRIRFLALALTPALTLATTAIAAPQLPASKVNEPVYVDTGPLSLIADEGNPAATDVPALTPDEAMVNNLQENLKEQALKSSEATPKKPANALDPEVNTDQGLAVQATVQPKFFLSDCESQLNEKLSDELGTSGLIISKLKFKRQDGNKTFTMAQIKNVNLNTKFTIDSIETKEDAGQFTASLKPQFGNFLIDVTGDYSLSQKIPVLSRNISKGNNITQNDIELKTLPVSEIPAGSVQDVADIIGKAASKALVKGKMVAEEDIKAPVLISKNTSVSAIYRNDALEIKALAVALDDGSEGDIIRLKNFDSGKVFKAIVQADGTVLIGNNSKDISASMTVPSTESTEQNKIN